MGTTHTTNWLTLVSCTVKHTTCLTFLSTAGIPTGPGLTTGDILTVSIISAIHTKCIPCLQDHGINEGEKDEAAEVEEEAVGEEPTPSTSSYNLIKLHSEY